MPARDSEVTEADEGAAAGGTRSEPDDVEGEESGDADEELSFPDTAITLTHLLPSRYEHRPPHTQTVSHHGDRSRIVLKHMVSVKIFT